MVVGMSLFVVVAVGSPSSADVTATTGSAFGASGSISLFGGAPIILAPTPSVMLSSNGGSQSDSATSAVLQAGPARVVRTGTLAVNTEGTTSAAGAVTSSATVTDPAVAGLNATQAASTCTATEAGVTGSTTITSGTLVTKHDPTTGDPVTTVDVPANPLPNLTFNGTVDNVGDSFRAVFNEQVMTAGAITVNAVHFYLLGPIAVGDLFVGQSVCGVTAVAASTTTSTTSGTSPSTSTTSSTSVSSTTTTRSSSTISKIAGAPDPGAGGGPTSPTRTALARTGFTPALALLAMLTTALGVVLLIGSAEATVSAGHGRRRRTPWDRRWW